MGFRTVPDAVDSRDYGTGARILLKRERLATRAHRNSTHSVTSHRPASSATTGARAPATCAPNTK